MYLFSKTLIVFCALAIAPLSSSVRADLTDDEALSEDSISIVVQVGILNDPKFPPITPKDAQEVLDFAWDIMEDRFGFRLLQISFDNKEESILDFFDRYPRRKSFNRGSRFPLKAPERIWRHKDKIGEFLKRWQLDSLQGFRPKKPFKDHKEFADFLIGVYIDRADKAMTSKIEENGHPLLSPDNRHQLYIDWVDVMEQQEDYDIVLTNTFVFLDNAVEPYPHSIFKHAKVGGASFDSPKRATFDGFTLMSSTFEFDTHIPFYYDSELGELSKSEKNKVLGAAIVAHEVGHMLFYIPDVYDHSPACLMDSRMENLSYPRAYRNLMKESGVCPECRPYIEARKWAFKAQSLSEKDEIQKAVGAYNKAIDLLPTDAEQHKKVIGRWQDRIRELSE